MADQTRHTAITQFRKWIEANVTEFDGLTDGDPTRVYDGPVLPGEQVRSRMPFMMCIEGPDLVDEWITPGRDITFELGLIWVLKDGLSGKSVLQTGRDIEDSIIKQTFLAGADQLKVAGIATILKTEHLRAGHPFLWPEIHKDLHSRGRVITITYRQET